MRLIALLLLLMFAGAASATDYYVATWGDNTTQGNITHPWQNVSYATQQADKGDTIHLFDGIWYGEYAVFANSGNATHPISITAYNGTPIMEGNKGTKTGTGLHLGYNDYIQISDLEIRDYRQTISYPGSYITVSDCVLWNTTAPDGGANGVIIDLAVGDSTNNTIENCTLYNSGWNTIQLYGNREPPSGSGIPATYITIRNCTIYNSTQHCAIDMYGNLQHVTIENNELYDNPSGCIYTHDGSDHREYLIIRDNYFHNTSSIPLNIDVTTHSKIYNNTFKNIYIGAEKADPINIDPGIADGSHDYEIYNNSFYNCSGPKISGAYNVTFNDNYLHSDVTIYNFANGAKCIVENPSGVMDIRIGDPSGTAELLFDDGTVFTASYYWLGSYVPVRYYPEKSNTSGVAKVADWGTINTVTTYNITLVPTNAYLKDVTVNRESNTTHDVTNVSVNSSVSDNPSTITATMQNASHTYNVSVDGVYITQVVSNAAKVAQYQYTSSWSPHTFEFDWFSGAGAASATAEVTQVGDTIYVWGSGWADLSYIETQISNASALTHTGTVFLAGANIHVNGTGTTLYINDSDCTHLQLNCSFGDVSDLRIDGYLEMADSKITSWNTSSSAVVTQTAATLSTQRSCVRFGDDANNCYANITNSEISHLGYNANGAVWGLSMNRWNDGEFRKVDIHHLYSIYMIRCENDCYNHTKIYNNSARGLEIYHFSHYLNIINTEVYYNYHLLAATGYGAGIWTNGQESDHMYIYNCTIRDNNGAQITLQTGDNATVSHSKVYGDDRLLELNGVTNSVCEYNTCWDGWRGLYNVGGITNTYRHNIVYNCTSGGITVYGIPGGSCMMWNNTAYGNEYNILFVSDSAGTKICNETISGAATATGVDICCDDGYNDAQVQDLNNYDNELSVRLWRTGRSLALNYTNNKIMNVTRSLTYYESTNTYYTDHSSLWARKTANEAPYIISMYLYNGTLSAGDDSVTIGAVNEWTETMGSECYNITVNSTNSTEICIFTANVANSTDNYGCYIDSVWSENVAAVGGIASWTYTGGFSEHDLEIRWNSTSNAAYTPPTPTTLANTTGSTWVRHSWSPGSGNVTDSYNVSVNSVWHNGTTNAYYQDTYLPGAWQNITIYAYNSSGAGTLSAGSVSQNTQTSGIIIADFVNPYFVSAGAAAILFVAAAGRFAISAWRNRRRKRRN